MTTRIRLCGRLEIEIGGERIDLPGRQGPLVLAVLAMHRGRPVPRGELIAALWPEAAPADPEEALSALLSKVRQAVGREVLIGRRELSLALPDGAEVDVEQARLAADRARTAIADGDWAAAGEAATVASEIAGRGFLAGHEGPWVEERRRELEELRLRALEWLAQAGLALGAHADGAERAAAELVRKAPLREAGHRLLMEALAARGEVAEALGAYERLRVLLRDELGTTPGDAVRALHERLLTGEPARPPAPGEPGLDQEIRFLETGAGRIAYASVGSGPPLILPALWISHLELEWDFPELRAFITGLASGRRVIRYDRIGTGLSDRPAVDPSLEAEVEVLEALTAEIGSDQVDLLGISFGGCTTVEFAARYPARVRRIALLGAYARGADIAPLALREALAAMVRAHWGAGSRALADIWIPGGDASVHKWFAELQRESATAEMAAAALEAVYAADVSAAARRVGAPALVLHRKRDRAIPFACGRELAALLPEGRLHALAGDTHLPWLGDQVTVVRAVRDFLAAESTSAPVARAVGNPLGERELAQASTPEVGTPTF